MRNCVKHALKFRILFRTSEPRQKQSWWRNPRLWV